VGKNIYFGACFKRAHTRVFLSSRHAFMSWFSLAAKSSRSQIKNRFQILYNELRGIILWWRNFTFHSHWHRKATRAVTQWRQRTVKCDRIECILVWFTASVQFNKYPLHVAYNTDLPPVINFTTGAKVKYLCNFVCKPSILVIKDTCIIFRWRFCNGSYTMSGF
jgi:hypothetical protein